MGGTEKRFTADGLEDLRVLMDALLPGVFRGGRPMTGRSPGQPETLSQSPSYQTVTKAGDREEWEAGRGRTTGNAGRKIRCLNPQTLAVARGDREVTRKRMDRYYHRGSLPGPRMKIFRIPNTVQAPGTGRRVTLQVSFRRSDGDLEGILPHHSTVFPEGTPPPGKGSRPGEVEA